MTSVWSRFFYYAPRKSEVQLELAPVNKLVKRPLRLTRLLCRVPDRNHADQLVSFRSAKFTTDFVGVFLLVASDPARAQPMRFGGYQDVLSGSRSVFKVILRILAQNENAYRGFSDKAPVLGFLGDTP